jgi:hypothetical protein
MKAKRRTFGKGYRSVSQAPDSRRSNQHRVLAKIVTKDAVCAWAHLGDCDGPIEAGHILPHAWDGESTLDNLRPECRHHNRKFGGRIRK